ncbi:MAG: lytic transglycosylase domain-containing protein [Pseudobdellovibrionaceae bacterium]|nr:lytic transglycosylase domain-containing protein [Bdellovibrionales bacterium]USN46809.1 MAG: lytic transglycosylase domain-containing protein [Pseudobdellovibrionaceae bacterium]
MNTTKIFAITILMSVTLFGSPLAYATSEIKDFLKDPAQLVSSDFRVKPVMMKRVGFWFDVYTKYPSTHHIIHHSRYPWIVFEVVDTSSFFKKKQAHWLENKKALDHVKLRRKIIRQELKSLASKPFSKSLSPLQRHLKKTLQKIGGPRGNVYRFASKKVRSQTGQRNFFVKGLKNSPKYLPLMEAEFQRQGLPKELLRIPFVESSFNEKAESRVGASGIWQIMPHIGKAYMKVTPHIDERNSPIKATEVAGKILKQNFRALKSWGLAVTAYNHGIGGLRKSLRKSKSTHLTQLISHYRGGSFGFASSNFYASFLAALHAETYKDQIFSSDEISPRPALNAQMVTLHRSMRPSQIAKLANLNIDDLKDLNHDIKRAIKNDIRLPKGFRVFLPHNSQFIGSN